MSSGYELDTVQFGDPTWKTVHSRIDDLRCIHKKRFGFRCVWVERLGDGIRGLCLPIAGAAITPGLALGLPGVTRRRALSCGRASV